MSVLMAVVTPGRAEHPPAIPAALPGTLTGPAPRGANTGDLAARLRALGLPPLDPVEGPRSTSTSTSTSLSTGAGSPCRRSSASTPAVGFAPLHVHDTSG